MGKRSYSYVCLGFVPILCFTAFKLMGMFEYSWLWILPMLFIGYFKKEKPEPGGCW